MSGFYVTDNSIILEDAFDLNNEDDKEARDNDDGKKDVKEAGDDSDGEEEDDDWGEGDDGDKEDFDGRVEEEDDWEEGNDKKSDKHYSGSGHFKTVGKSF